MSKIHGCRSSAARDEWAIAVIALRQSPRNFDCRQHHLAHNRIGHQREQLVLRADVVVQRHRPGADFLRETPHRQRVDAFGVGDADGRVRDVVASEPGLARARLFPHPQIEHRNELVDLVGVLRGLLGDLVGDLLDLLRDLVRDVLPNHVAGVGSPSSRILGITPCHVVQRTTNVRRTMYEHSVRHTNSGRSRIQRHRRRGSRQALRSALGAA